MRIVVSGVNSEVFIQGEDGKIRVFVTKLLFYLFYLFS